MSALWSLFYDLPLDLQQRIVMIMLYTRPAYQLLDDRSYYFYCFGKELEYFDHGYRLKHTQDVPDDHQDISYDFMYHVLGRV